VSLTPIPGITAVSKPPALYITVGATDMSLGSKLRPNVMYNAGGLLTAVIPGIGVNDTSKIDLVSNTGVSLC
jgi:hypothetical protein